ncbi:MAG: hypothetical protein NTV88_02570 [Candidatus Micrarchaeota archaeon]|nr:hypothetical protein [Candidatus Micrarchaeota archaeon]
MQPYFNFQKTAGSAILEGACPVGQSAAFAGLDAYASGKDILLFLPHENNFSALFSISGDGGFEDAFVAFDEPGLALDRVLVNGKVLCAPCENGNKYALEGGRAEGGLLLEAQGHATDLKQGLERNQGGLHMAFFELSSQTHALAPLKLSITGSWNAVATSRMPSSFYGEDAPFHINRVPVLAGYLMQLKVPWSTYGFVSMVPPALFYAATGLPYQYAYKIYAILLFFVPVVIFYLFSRKLPKYQDVVFAISSLLYLCLPMGGMPLGGGLDLFAYGMTPHTIATYLSLFFFYAAYEAVIERKKLDSVWLLGAAVIFMLAFAANPRILAALAIGFVIVAAAALAQKRLKRAVLLLIACASASAWLAASFLSGFSISSYSIVGGATPGGAVETLRLLFQLGYIALPLLFAAGAYFAWRGRNLFAFAVAGYSAAMFAFATSAGLLQAYPFLDVLRFLPSFYLPFIFVCGAGIAALAEKAPPLLGVIGKKLRLEKDTLAVAVMLAVLAPSAMFLMIFWNASSVQYSNAGDSLEAASGYSSFASAHAIIGSERALLVTRTDVSQYPAFEQNLEKLSIKYLQDPPSIASEMEKQKLRYVIVGNAIAVRNENETTAWQFLDAMRGSPLFAEVFPGSAAHVFMLKGALIAPDAAGVDVAVEGADLRYDGASVAGECRADSCNVTVYSKTISKNAVCNGAPMQCGLTFIADSGSILVSGMKRGRFNFDIAPQHGTLELALLALGLIGLVICAYECRKS